MQNILSGKGIEFLKQWEGVKYEVYLDPIGLPTVGVGHLLTEDEKRTYKVGQKITAQEVDALLRRDISSTVRAVNNWVIHELDQHEFDAVVSLVFNIGVNAFKRSTLLKKLNRGQDKEAAKEFLRWNRAGGKVIRGLTRRRESEMDLFLNGYK